MTQQLHPECIFGKKKKNKAIQPDTYALMFIAALLTFAKVWKKMDKEDVIYSIYNGILLSCKKE